MTSNLIVQTTFGPVRGAKKVSCFGQSYVSFQGIPYAKPFNGNLRFRDALDPEPWTEIFDATKEGPATPNNDRMNPKPSLIGTDSGLVINVYVPSLEPKSQSLPVLAYIHGGGFVTGSGSTDYYGPDFFMQKEVVLVTFNYRLGIYGFLSLKDPKLGIPGNAGLKDQLKALKWIKANISKFGGNPNNVTLFGESAGGTSVHYHMISEASKGLFHKAIVMSGSIYCPWAWIDASGLALRLAKAMGYKRPENEAVNEAKVLAFLEAADPKDLILVNESLVNIVERRTGIYYATVPTVEPYVTETTFIPENPILMARKAWSKDMNVIFGGCSDEGLLLYRTFIGANNDYVRNFVKFEYLLPRELEFTAEKRKEMANMMRKLYYNREEPSLANLEKYLQLAGDKFFWHATHRTVLSRLQYGSGNNYLYRFELQSELFNIFRKVFLLPDHLKGACHAEDVLYVFKSNFLPTPQKGSLEYETIMKMVGFFTKFAKDGDPNGESIAPLKWEPVQDTKKTLSGIEIGKQWKVGTFSELDRMAVWDIFYKDQDLI